MHFLPENSFSEVALTAASTEIHRRRTVIWLKGLVIPGHAALLGSFPPSSAWQVPPGAGLSSLGFSPHSPPPDSHQPGFPEPSPPAGVMYQIPEQQE